MTAENLNYIHILHAGPTADQLLTVFIASAVVASLAAALLALFIRKKWKTLIKKPLAWAIFILVLTWLVVFVVTTAIAFMLLF